MGAVTLRFGAIVWGLLTATPGAVAGVTNGDQPYILVVSKTPGVTIPAPPTDWKFVPGADITVNAAGTVTGNQGPMRIQIMKRDTVVSGGAITWPTVDNGAANASKVIGVIPVLAAPASGQVITDAISFGEDLDGATTWSVTGLMPVTLGVDDAVIALSAICDNGPTSSAGAISASGITFGATTERIDSQTGNGDDAGCFVHSAVATAGTAEVAPVLAQTLSTTSATQNRGGTMLLRLRSAIPPDEVLGIGTAGKYFKLQTPLDNGGVALEKTQAEIVAGYTDQWFHTTSDGLWVHFEARADGARTAGSSFARCELREVAPDGSNTNWNATVDEHIFTGTTRIPHLSPTTPAAVVAQVFGEDAGADIMSIRTQLVSATIRLRVRVDGTSVTSPQIASPYTPGDIFNWKMRLTPTAREFYWSIGAGTALPGTPDVSQAATTETHAYFKAGCYNQANQTTEPANEYFAVEHQNLLVVHNTLSVADFGDFFPFLEGVLS